MSQDNKELSNSEAAEVVQDLEAQAIPDDLLDAVSGGGWDWRQLPVPGDIVSQPQISPSLDFRN